MTLRLTKQRSRILDLLKVTARPLSAAAIHELLVTVDLVTVYRTLDRFVAEGLIKRVSLGSGEALFEYQPEPHHHALCTDCQRVIHFTAPDEKIKALLGLKEFAIKELEVTVRGTCTKKRLKK